MSNRIAASCPWPLWVECENQRPETQDTRQTASRLAAMIGQAVEVNVLPARPIPDEWCPSKAGPRKTIRTSELTQEVYDQFLALCQWYDVSPAQGLLRVWAYYEHGYLPAAWRSLPRDFTPEKDPVDGGVCPHCLGAGAVRGLVDDFFQPCVCTVLETDRPVSISVAPEIDDGYDL